MSATARDILKRWARKGRGHPVRNVPVAPSRDAEEGRADRTLSHLPRRTRDALETVFSVFPEAEVLELSVRPVDLELAGWSEEARYVFHERVGVFVENGLEEAEAEGLARIEARRMEDLES